MGPQGYCKMKVDHVEGPHAYFINNVKLKVVWGPTVTFFLDEPMEI